MNTPPPPPPDTPTRGRAAALGIALAAIAAGIAVGILAIRTTDDGRDAASSAVSGAEARTSTTTAPATAATNKVKTTTTTTTTTATTTTTRPPADPQVELERIAASATAKDYSIIAEAPCGRFAMVNGLDRTLFLSWNGNAWDEQSWVMNDVAFLEGVSDKVTTREYTSDGILDFLVFWEAEPLGLPRSVGGILSMHGSATCDWTWRPIQDGDSTNILLDGLYYDDQLQSLYGTGYLDDGPRQLVRVRGAGGTFFTTGPNEFLGDGG
jgi:hypothetical protein